MILHNDLQYLDKKLHEDSDYVALCDVAERVSCSAVITSEYSKLFSLIGLVPIDSFLDVPNANYGVVFYSVLFILYLFSLRHSFVKVLVLLAAVASSVLSLALFYIMVYILQDICVVCMCTHACNAIVLIVAVLDVRDDRVPVTRTKRE